MNIVPYLDMILHYILNPCHHNLTIIVFWNIKAMILLILGFDEMFGYEGFHFNG
jgi:hypothetical protein